MVIVSFIYCEKTRRWTPIVMGADDGKTARQAFNAVVLTCQELDKDLLNQSKTEVFECKFEMPEYSFEIIPAI